MNDIKLIHIALEAWEIFFCALSTVLVFYLKGLEPNKKKMLLSTQIINSFLLIFDCLAWFYRGYPGKIGWIMVRISNFMVFAIVYAIIVILTKFFLNYVPVEHQKSVKTEVKIVNILSGIGWGTLIVNIFYPCIYDFMKDNLYYRLPAFWGFQTLGLAALLVDGVIYFKIKKWLSREMQEAMEIFILLPFAAVVIQLKFYGASLINLAISISLMILFMLVVLEQSKRLVEEGKNVNEMKISLLISQIGPHFMFNMLNTIKYLCRINPKEAENTIDQFAVYLRGNIDSLSINECIPFTKDFVHMQNYVELEKKRFGDKINISYDITAVDFKIPPLTLQPLVENAIKHGITEKKDGGSIKIKSYEEEMAYVVMIEDNGVGFDCSDIDESRVHVGVTNTRSRIEKMTHGSFEIKSRKNVGTTVTIRVPKWSESD